MIYIKLCIFNIWVFCITLIGGADESSVETSTDFILCRLCGFNIAPATFVVNAVSPAAEKVRKYSLFGLEQVEVQSLRNPLGVKFNIITAKAGTCIASSKRWQIDHSWFPGHAWKPCVCSRCSRHIGWAFEPLSSAHEERIYASVNGLYAFILENVLSETYVDSLLVTPKLYSYT